MTFHGKFPIRTKLMIDYIPIEQMSHLKYLGCDVTYENDQDVREADLHSTPGNGGRKTRDRNKLRPIP